ncbi:alanine--tRNA ligase-like [Daphnia magna]|uniref:alanine--tRNA ligase-like n=1 Tax=Daphnia magna TaxID=35525 RepID=UPI001E1BA491|nr:alanine--tRNA ligase-like [Daphnia magna]
MGFERLVRVIQEKTSNYDTDIFMPIIEANYIRAISFTIADGQIPSNTGASYVIRRILRRAVRYGYSFLDFQTPFMHQLVGLLAMNNAKSISGKDAFTLYDTYGFPFDLTQLMAQEAGIMVDEAAFEKELQIQKKDRQMRRTKLETEDWEIIHPELDGKATQFIGYTDFESNASIVKIRKVVAKNQSFYQIVLDKTPFYARKSGRDSEIQKLESMVNAKIQAQIDLKEEQNIPIDEAKSRGVMALFGEKYGEFVRVITFDAAFSQELCGGTHVKNTGEIEYFKIISESSISAGVRRIEAITSQAVLEFYQGKEAQLEEIALAMKNPQKLLPAIQNLMQETAQQEIIKNIATQLRAKHDDVAIALVYEEKEKLKVAIAISDAVQSSKSLMANQIAKELGQAFNGGGGGRPSFSVVTLDISTSKEAFSKKWLELVQK